MGRRPGTPPEATHISGHHAAYYPAQRGTLRLLHSGGVGARAYVGYPRLRPRSTVTLLEIDRARRTLDIQTFDAESGERVELRELPSCINGYNGPVFRIDLPQAARCGAGN